MNGLSPQEANTLLQECVRADTVNPPGNEARMTAILATRLEQEGISVSVTNLAPGRANLLAHLPGTGGRPALVLGGHTDTVPPGEAPWQSDPWSGLVVGDRLYGRGACDMKSGLAAMVMAMIGLKRQGVRLGGDLVLAASAGEEVDCLGARAFVEAGQLQGAGAMVIGEPTGSRVVIAHKGALWLSLTTTGQTAHGSMPETGINSILRMQPVIQRLSALNLRHRAHDLLGGPSLSINTIVGGNKTNVVPDRCRVEVDIRTVPQQQHGEVLQEIRTALADLPGPIHMEVLNDRPPVVTDPEAPVVQAALRLTSRLIGAQTVPTGAPYFTDASIYQPALRLPVLIWGPGVPHMAHQPDEWVELSAYLDAIRFYSDLVVEYLGVY